jgi:hypothetical protein
VLDRVSAEGPLAPPTERYDALPPHNSDRQMVPSTAEEFRDRAAAARRLADSIREPRVIEGLRQLADEYENEAAELEVTVAGTLGRAP